MSGPVMFRATDEERPEFARFGKRLWDARLAAKLGRSALAQKAQLSDATIKFIETLRTRPTLQTVAAIIGVPELGLGLDDAPSFLQEALAPILSQQRRIAIPRPVSVLCPHCRGVLIPCTEPHDYCTQTSYRIAAPSSA